MGKWTREDRYMAVEEHGQEISRQQNLEHCSRPETSREAGHEGRGHEAPNKNDKINGMLEMSKPTLHLSTVQGRPHPKSMQNGKTPIERKSQTLNDTP